MITPKKFTARELWVFKSIAERRTAVPYLVAITQATNDSKHVVMRVHGDMVKEALNQSLMGEMGDGFNKFVEGVNHMVLASLADRDEIALVLLQVVSGQLDLGL